MPAAEMFPPSPATTPVPPAAPVAKESLLHVHLAEYQALTTRISYWITLQYLTYSVGAVVLSILAQAWGTTRLRPATLAWVGFFLVLLLVWGWVYIVWEILNTAFYLESRLRPRVRDLINDKEFWGWERYLARQRSTGYNRYEWTFALLFLLIVGVLVFGWSLRGGMGDLAAWRSYWGWAAVSVYALVMIGARVREVLALQVRLRGLEI